MFRKTVFLKNALLDNLCGVYVLLHARSPFFIFIMDCRRKKIGASHVGLPHWIVLESD